MKTERNYLIGENMLLETNYLSLLGMISNCSTPDITMLRWISYIRHLNLFLIHNKDKENIVVDMLSRVRYINREEMIA